MSPFDPYVIKARIAPALIVLIPAASLAAAWFPKLTTFAGLSAAALTGIAAAMLIARQTREAGKRLQDNLVRDWGAMPTTIILRHSDTVLGAGEKARYHALLQSRVQRIQMPDAATEARDPAAADRTYEIATAWLRENTRGNPVVNDENATYGFYRNLCALRPLGLLSAVAGISGSTLLLYLEWTPEALASTPVLSLGLSVVCGLVMTFHATPAQVRNAADSYAVALIRAIDSTPPQ